MENREKGLDLGLGPEADRPLWLRMPDPDDESTMGQLRREVLEIARELETTERPGADASAASTRSGTPLPPELAEPLDIRATTPFLLSRARHALRHRLEGGGGTRDGRALVLLEIGRSNGAVPLRLARALGIRRSSLSRIVAMAERDGLVRRRPHHYDGRTCLLELTPAGRRVAADAAAGVREADRALLDAMTAAERDELRRLLRRAAGALAGTGATP